MVIESEWQVVVRVVNNLLELLRDIQLGLQTVSSDDLLLSELILAFTVSLLSVLGNLRQLGGLMLDHVLIFQVLLALLGFEPFSLLLVVLLNFFFFGVAGQAVQEDPVTVVLLKRLQVF